MRSRRGAWHDAATSAGTTTLGYDFESRLVSMSAPGIAATYAYNGLDARRGKTMNGVSRSYLRDGAYVTDPLLHDGEAAYTPGASVREYGATKYLHSGLKNADAQSGSAQTLTATRLYDAFGNLDSRSGSWTGALGYGGPYGYQSASEGGLMLLGHRYYDPSTGRFLTRDPVKDGRNWYAYCEGNPTGFADPGGLRLVGVTGGGQFIGIIGSVSLSLTIGFDPDTGDFGMNVGIGFGPAAGLGGGLFIGGVNDPTSNLKPGPTRGKVVGAQLGPVGLEFPVDGTGKAQPGSVTRVMPTSGGAWVEERYGRNVRFGNIRAIAYQVKAWWDSLWQ